MQLIDIGVNLTHASFAPNLDQIIKRAMNNEVVQMIVTGASIKSSIEALELAKKHPGVLYCTAGVHPHDVKQCDSQTISKLRELTGHKEVVALGECGLDYNRNFSPRPVQDRWFEEQIKLACELKLPLFIHEREAHKRLVEIMMAYKNQLPPTVIHCFTGSEEELAYYLECGFYIGLTGWICDERRGTHLQALVHKIPLDRLMLETDAPFLIPRNMPKTGQSQGQNEPAFLPYVLRKVAQCLGKNPQEIASCTTATARKFFNLS